MFQLLVNNLTRGARRLCLTALAIAGLCLLAGLTARLPVASAASGACTLPATDYGTVGGLSITTTGVTTNIYSRMAILDATDNSYLLEIDNSSDVPISCYTVSAGAGAVYAVGASQHFNSDGSNWVNTAISDLPAGTYHLKLIGSAPSVLVDRLILAQNTNCTPVGTGDNCVQQDTTPPTVSVATAGDVASVGTSASPVTVTATASDNVAIARVEFYVDGNLVGSDASTPYTYSFNPNNFAIASHTIVAKAFDSSGNTTTSGSKSLTVTDTTSPTASVTSPTNGTVVSGSINLAAQATDNTAVTKVNFYADGPAGTLLKTVNSGTSNVAVTKANSGGASGTAFGSVSLVGSATLLYDAGAAAHGGLSYHVTATGSDKSQAYLFNSSANLISSRVYFRLNSFSGAQQILSIQEGATPFTFVAKAGISAAGYFTVTDASGTLYTSPSAVTVGTWYRLELQAKVGTTTSNGTINFQYYQGDSTTPVSTFGTVNANTGTLALGRAVFGKFDSGPSLDANFDDFAFDINTLTPIGPVTQNPSSATLVQNNAEGGVLSFSGSYTGTLSAGTHNITATAYDAAGNSTTSAPISVTVPDTTPPVISSIQTSNITGSGATITWTTDENSDSQVEYGLTTSYGSSTTLNTTMTKSHSVALSSLSDTATYHYRVKSKDASGNLSTSSDQTFTTPDATKPSVSITAPSSGAVISTTTSVNASASDNVAVTKVEFYVNGSLKYTDNATPWSYSFDPAIFGVGSYTLTAQAYDAAGNTTISAPINVTVPDTTAPVISNVAITGIGGNQATITWTTDENADTQVDYGTTSSYGSSSTLNASKVQSHSVTLSGLADATTYHFRVKSKDAAGNLATSTDRTFATPDITKPSVAITSPANGSSQTGVITVSVSASDNVGVDHVDLYVGSTLKQSLASSPYNFSLDTQDYTNGSYVLGAKAYDAAGNEQSTTITINVNNVTTPPPDTTPPSVSISSPAGNSVFNITGSAFSVNATAGDNIGVTRVEFYVDGTLIAMDDSGPYSYSLSPSSLGGGNHTLTAKAYDAAGNSTTSAGVQITVKDTEKPTVSIVSPSAGSTQGGVINVQASAADNVGVSSVQFFLDSNPTPIGTANTESGGYYTISLSTIPQSPGNHSIYAIASDAASNTSQSATVSFIINNDFSVSINGFAINPVLNKDSGGSRYNNSAYPVSLSIQSINPVQSVSVKLDGVALSVSPVAPNYSFTLNLTGLAIGQHNLAVTVTDSVGNTAIAAESFKVTYAADINSDYHVDYLDISALSHDYSKTGSGLGRVDINGDGIVDYLDISALSNAYGK